MANRPPTPPRGTLELYHKAVKLHCEVFKKEIWSLEKYKKKTGHMLQSLYGKSVWTFKDLADFELQKIIELC